MLLTYLIYPSSLLLPMLEAFHCTRPNHLKTFHLMHKSLKEGDEKTRRKSIQKKKKKKELIISHKNLFWDEKTRRKRTQKRRYL